MSRYGVLTGPYFPAFGLNTERYEVFSPNAGKYGPEKTPYLDTFHAVLPIISKSEPLHLAELTFTFDSPSFFSHVRFRIYPLPFLFLHPLQTLNSKDEDMVTFKEPNLVIFRGFTHKGNIIRHVLECFL